MTMGQCIHSKERFKHLQGSNPLNMCFKITNINGGRLHEVGFPIPFHRIHPLN